MSLGFSSGPTRKHKPKQWMNEPGGRCQVTQRRLFLHLLYRANVRGATPFWQGGIASSSAPLTLQGIPTRTSHPEAPPRVEYALTLAGRELFPCIDHRRECRTKWLSSGDAASDAMPSDREHRA